MKKLAKLLLGALMAVSCFGAAAPVSVTKTDGVTNNITAPLVFPSAQSLTFKSGSHLTVESGTIVTGLSGSGTVTSVGLSGPAGFSVTGTPVTGAGTLAFTISFSGLAKGNGSGLVAATSGTDYAPATSGSSILKGNGSGGFSAAVSNTDYLAAAAINLAGTGAGGVTGILALANGGSGTATPSLVAGTNVTITGSWPNQTVNSSGGGGGSPGGSSGQIQYNNASAFGGFTMSGDATTNTGTGALTLATVNSNVGTFGSATASPAVTVNAKGLVTAASNITITPAVGSITGLGTGVGTWLATPSGANLASALTTALPETKGGTNQTTYATGDLIQATGSNTLGKLAAVATGNVVISGGVATASSWGKVGLTTHVTGTLAEGNGGIGITSGTSGGVLYQSGTTTVASSALLASGNIVVGGGTGTAPYTTGIQVDGSNNVTGVGNITVGNSTVTGSVTGNIGGATAHGQLLIGNVTSGLFEKAVPTVGTGTGITITLGAGSVAISGNAAVADGSTRGIPGFSTANFTASSSIIDLAATAVTGGSYGSATGSPTFTVDAKGRLTAAANVTITPAVGSVTGLGTNVATALGVNVGTAGAFVVGGGALGTPSSGTLTNAIGLPQAGTVGLTTADSPQFAALNVGDAADTTITRVSAGVIAVEGSTLLTKAATTERIATFTIDGGGSAITAATVAGTVRIPFACTLVGWSITATAATGTNTIKIWNVATGTAIPTVANVINTSGVSLTTGTAVTSTTISDFTDTSYAALDMMRCAVTAVDGAATDITVTLYGTRN